MSIFSGGPRRAPNAAARVRPRRLYELRKPRWMSRVLRRSMTGRPCGQVVGEEVWSRREMSQRIFSTVSGVLTFMAARQASEAATRSRKDSFARPRFSASAESLQLFGDFAEGGGLRGREVEGFGDEQVLRLDAARVFEASVLVEEYALV